MILQCEFGFSIKLVNNCLPKSRQGHDLLLLSWKVLWWKEYIMCDESLRLSYVCCIGVSYAYFLYIHSLQINGQFVVHNWLKG